MVSIEALRNARPGRRPGYGTPPCASVSTPATVNNPPGATPSQIFDLGQAASRAANMESPPDTWIRRLLGEVRAQAALGLAYVNGKGEPKDIAKAVYWLTLAADQGSRAAQAQVGDLYQEGNGVAQNNAKAFQYHLATTRGLDYELGLGTASKRQQAIYWLEIATTTGRTACPNNW